MRLLPFCLSLAAPMLCALDARAAGEPRIVVVAREDGDPIAVRLRAELRALHFEVVDSEAPPDPPSREPLEEAAQKNNAVAAVRVVPSSAGVEVWIVDRVTGKTVLREIVSDETRSSSGSATIALRVVELLRASLMELDAPRAPPGEVAPPAGLRQLIEPRRAPMPGPLAVAPAAAREAPPFSVEVGPAVLLSPGGLSPSGVLAAGVHLRPADRFGASLFAWIPVVASQVEGPEGAASGRIGLLGAGIRASLQAPGSAWSLAGGGGFSVLWLRFEGSPNRHFEGSSADLFTIAPYLRAGVALSVLPRLRLRGDVLSGVAMQRPVVKFAGREVAFWGVPFVAPSLGLELVWR